MPSSQDLSPILNLAPEILSDIFAYSVRNKNPCESEAPTNVSSVCKSWRQIAISTPYLWSEVHINQQSPNMRIPAAHTIQTWISRSGSRGFSFVISRIKAEVLDESEFIALIDVLLENCNVWRKVHITMQKNYSAELLSMIPIWTPNLRKLSIDGFRFSIANLFNAPLIHLTHLHICSPTVYSTPGSSLLLENLRFLNLIGVSHSDFVECLSRSPRVEDVKAVLDFIAEESRHIQGRGSFNLEHLEHLRITVRIRTCNQGQRGPFDHIHLPALKTLLLLVHDYNYANRSTGDSQWDFSINMVSRYEATLQNLEIETRCCGVPQPDFIRRFRSLKHLGIHVSVLNADFIRTLVSRFPSSTNPQCHQQVSSCLESLRIFDFSRDDHGPILSAIIDLAETERSSIAVHPIIIIIPRPLVLPQDSVVEIMGTDDWKKRRHDLYRPSDS